MNGFGVYVPPNNIAALDWSLTSRFNLTEHLPPHIDAGSPFTREVDVIWLSQTHDAVSTLFEVEHSTPIYSGMLRFNDLLLTCPVAPRFFIVSNEARRDLFSKQVQRPTFQRSGLAEVTSFLDYANVFAWHRRLCPQKCI
jgi:type II restriction enzyme